MCSTNNETKQADKGNPRQYKYNNDMDKKKQFFY